MKLESLEAKAETLKAVNSAKYKAAGKTHRCEIQIFSMTARYQKTIVLYVKAKSDQDAKVAALKTAIHAGTKCISLSAESAIIQTL